MSITAIRPYFDARMRAINPDFREWVDSLEPEEIPNTIIDYIWHLKIDLALFRSLNQNCIEYDVPVTLTTFQRAGREAQSGIDLGHKQVEDILREVCNPINRLTQPTVKNVLPGSVRLDPIDTSNDNLIKVSVEFTAKIILTFN